MTNISVMAKSTIKRQDGTIITIEGTPQEIKEILALHSASPKVAGKSDKVTKPLAVKSGKTIVDEQTGSVEIDIVNQLKECDESDSIEQNILDHSSQVDRVLLPLYSADKHLADKPMLTSGQIMKVLKELGINMSMANISKTLRGTASKYVMGDRQAKSGEAVLYKISRRGIQYMNEVLST